MNHVRHPDAIIPAMGRMDDSEQVADIGEKAEFDNGEGKEIS